MRIALRYALDEQEAAAIVSHSFLKMFRSIHTYDSAKGTFHTWLRKILVNEAIDHIKQRSRFSTKELTEAEEAPVNNGIVEQTDAAAILEMIRRLPPATHAVFVLYAVEGYTHKEIAARLNISDGTSKWHLSEARKFLQQQLTMQS